MGFRFRAWVSGVESLVLKVSDSRIRLVMLAASVKARGRGDVTGIGINMTTTRSSRGEKGAYFTCWIFECVVVMRTPHAVCVEVGVHTRPFVGVFQSQFLPGLSTSDNSSHQNGSNNGETAPRPGTGCPHEGPSVGKARGAAPKRRGGGSKGFKDFHLTAKAGIWP